MEMEERRSRHLSAAQRHHSTPPTLPIIDKALSVDISLTDIDSTLGAS
jgi:hypothetical protein